MVTELKPCKTRKEKAGKKMAEALLEWAHMMYNYRTARGVIQSLIFYLQEGLKEFVPIKKGDKHPRRNKRNHP